MCPLSALRFVASYGVGVFYLHGIEMAVVTESLHTIGLQRNICIVGQHLLIELLLLSMCERGRLRYERVENYGGVQLEVVVVGKAKEHVGEAKAIEFVYVAHPFNDATVAVGNERRLLLRRLLLVFRVGRREVFVLYHHEYVAPGELLFAPEHHVPDALVVNVGAFVAACNDHCLVGSHLGVAAVELLDEVVTTHESDVWKAVEAYLGQRGGIVVGNHGTYGGGIIQYAALLALAKNLAKVAFVDGEAIPFDHQSAKGRRLILAYWRQLSSVSDEQHTAVLSTIYIMYEVVEQPSAAEHAACAV